MAKNLSLGAILTIVVVTALVVSIATASITGNVIVKKSPSGTANVYYKTEINNLLKNYYKKTEIPCFSETFNLTRNPETNESTTKDFNFLHNYYTFRIIDGTDFGNNLKAFTLEISHRPYNAADLERVTTRGIFEGSDFYGWFLPTSNEGVDPEQRIYAEEAIVINATNFEVTDETQSGTFRVSKCFG